MINKFLSFVESNNIAINNSKILLAISGGVDSVVLAHILSYLKVDFGLAHCNFNLRGEESNADEQFVHKLANNLGVEYYVESFNTVKVAKIKGVSIQMAARDLRYNWFEKIRKEFLYDLVCTAHHKGDVAETMLFNLTKGTGLEGLHGINAQHNRLIRPMLFASRKEVIDFALKNTIVWREDSSNTSIKYSRNKIRHQVIPVLEEINPKAQDSIYSVSKRIKHAELFLNFAYKNMLKNLVSRQKDNIIINIKKLTDIPGYLHVLYKILEPYGFNYSQTESVAEAFNGLSGKLFYSVNHIANIDRKTLIISPITKEGLPLWLKDCEASVVKENFEMAIKILPGANYTIKDGRHILALDKSKLKFPLKIRSWELGDAFYPLGMTGKKKLSDYMIDAKIPVNLKDKVKVVVSDSQIVGILNHRLDRRFKVEATTKIIFEITYK